MPQNQASFVFLILKKHGMSQVWQSSVTKTENQRGVTHGTRLVRETEQLFFLNLSGEHRTHPLSSSELPFS